MGGTEAAVHDASLHVTNYRGKYILEPFDIEHTMLAKELSHPSSLGNFDLVLLLRGYSSILPCGIN